MSWVNSPVNGARLHHQLEILPIAALAPYARNSRTHSAEQVAQLAASIAEFGFTNPVLIDEAGGIIAGHGRVMAAKSLALAEVPCIRLSGLTDDQKRAYVIADNKLALNAGWDETALRAELDALRANNYDLNLLGFSEDELSTLFEPVAVEGGGQPRRSAGAASRSRFGVGRRVGHGPAPRGVWRLHRRGNLGCAHAV